MTDSSRRPIRLVDPMPVLRAAYAEAATTNHAHVGSEHVALAALGGPDGFEAIARDLGLDPSAVRPALLACCTEAGVKDQPAITPRTATMVALACQMALVEGCEAVASRHLVVALLREPGAMAWRGLVAAGLHPALVNESLGRLMGGPAPTPAGTSHPN